MMIGYTVIQGIQDSIFSIVVVYALLFLLTLIIAPFKYIKDKEKTSEDTIDVPQTQPLSIDDIKDEDMMVATIIASIDARETLKTDVVVKSVKEIK
ncbi:MAG: hypothetical protein WC479_03250 [Candidatus Izemoplasmatales bacterium]|jgi:hypothetical protein|nr:hypothetical protein [Candidatus Izemoplasmatales bacterium]MDD3865435.1 hypothetical protein [Candidatus Izemoplasmatales bacterium]